MSSEEYLDSLLKSMEESSGSDEPSPLVKKIFTDVDDYESEKDMSSFSDVVNDTDIFANPMFEEEGPSGNEILMGLNNLSDTDNFSDINTFEDTNIFEDSGIEESDLLLDEDLKASLDELLAAADETKTIAEADLEQVAVDDMDVTQYIDNMSELDDSLVEINELLKKSDNNETVEADEEMKAFLSSFDFDEMKTLLSDDEDSEGAEADADKESKPKKKISLFAGKKDKEKKNKKERASKKSKKAKKEENTADSDGTAMDNDSGWSAIDFGESALEDNAVNEDNIEDIAASFVAEEGQLEEPAKKQKKQKKPGFIRQLLDVLSSEEEDAGELLNALDENDEILKDLENEDKAKKNKKDKKKKEKKGKKGGNAEGKAEKPVKPKKPKKEKKVKDPLEKEIERSNKVLSKRGFITLIAFCSSLVAIIVALAFFLTDYADKKNARQAFYVGDYQKAYILLYDKVLSDSDALILERVRVVLELERNVEAYDFYKKTEDEAMALNALLEGVQNYHEIAEVNDFGSGKELTDIYQEILRILESEYGVSEDEAFALNACDADEYTIKVYDIVNGTGSENDETKEQEGSQQIEDVLPEEEGIINLETENEGV